MPQDLDDFFPSLDQIFSAPNLIKPYECKPKEADQDDKENVERKKRVKFEGMRADLEPVLSVNTAVFVTDKFKGGYVPAIIIDKTNDNNIFTVKMFDGRIEKLGRRFIFSPDDKEFYSINTVSLNKIMSTENSLIRPFEKELIVKFVDECKEELIKILKGETESERDVVFRSGIQRRSSMNNESASGPFTLEEYNFLLEYFPDEFIPSILTEFRNNLEERFEKTGESLDHLLRQYAYLVLVPEFIIRHILNVDDTVKTLEDANFKLLNNSNAYDVQTGNFINYLYSKQEMYQYARREIIEPDSILNKY